MIGVCYCCFEIESETSSSSSLAAAAAVAVDIALALPCLFGDILLLPCFDTGHFDRASIVLIGAKIEL